LVTGNYYAKQPCNRDVNPDLEMVAIRNELSTPILNQDGENFVD
jgi:hypothetical protein